MDKRECSLGYFANDTTALLATVAGSDPVDGQIVYKDDRPRTTEGVQCWICQQGDHPETLFKPCKCEGMCHRHCFRKWRQGWINPRNYFCCPNCLHSYNIERIRPSQDYHSRAIRQFHWQLAKLWITLSLVLCLSVAAMAGICYGLDQEHKNIPVAVKWMLSSVVNGVPTGNTTAVWEDDFHKPDYHVWPYYTLFSVFLVSVFILILFSCFGCTFNEHDRRGCCTSCCEGCNSNPYCWYCYDPCPHSNCYCFYGGGGGNCGDCNCRGLNCSGGGGGGGGEAIAIILLVVVVAIIISAVFVVIFYAASKTALLYDRYTQMLRSQAAELEGETIVLGIDEAWRPNNAV